MKYHCFSQTVLSVYKRGIFGYTVVHLLFGAAILKGTMVKRIYRKLRGPIVVQKIYQKNFKTFLFNDGEGNDKIIAGVSSRFHHRSFIIATTIIVKKSFDNPI